MRPFTLHLHFLNSDVNTIDLNRVISSKYRMTDDKTSKAIISVNDA